MTEPACHIRLPRPWGPEPPTPPGWTWPALMQEALAQAGLASARSEVPVGAVLVDAAGRVLGLAHNETISLRDPTAHAEVLALRRAAAALGNHRLEGCVLVATLEPCLMCVGALREARVSGLIYGAEDSRAGAVCSLLNGLELPSGGAVPWHWGGVNAEACAGILRHFFQRRRP